MAWWMPFARQGGRAYTPPPARSGAKSDEPGTLKDWQKQAWGYYKVLGEIHYGAGFYARMMSGVRLYGERRDPATGEWAEIEQADDPYVQELERLENARGGMAALQGTYGTLTFVQGESMLCCTLEGFGVDAMGEPILNANGDAYSEVWEMLSAAELSYSKGEKMYTRRRGGTGAGASEKIPETDTEDPRPGTMIAYRFYHRDPEYSGLADSSMRAVLADCEELMLLKQSIRNTARNRGAGNGVLILPSSLGGDLVDAGDGTKVPKNAKAIFDSLTAPIANENAASAVSPVILFGNDVTSQNAFHVDLRGAALYRETGLRDECIRRIAIGLDMPPENLLGTAGVNHWTAWQIDESAWKNHGANVARELCEQLTSALLKPLALDLGDDPADVRVWFDPTEVVEDPDRGRAAMEAHDRLIISDAAARRDLGYEEEDAPTPEEWDKRAAAGDAIKTTTPNPAKGAPRQGEATAERIIGMAEAAVLRCRELAGSRLRTKMQSNGTAPNLRARIKSAPNEMVAAKLGADIRDECDPDSLVAGAGMVFLRGLRNLGLEPGLSETLVRRVEEHAARTLFDEDPGPLPEDVIGICGLTSMRV